MTKAQQKAKRKYLAKGKRIIIDFYPTEKDLIEHVEKQPKKQTYIKDLIRKDMEHGQWGFDGIGWACSECGEYDMSDTQTKFCPNCGVKMDK